MMWMIYDFMKNNNSTPATNSTSTINSKSTTKTNVANKKTLNVSKSTTLPKCVPINNSKKKIKNVQTKKDNYLFCGNITENKSIPCPPPRPNYLFCGNVTDNVTVTCPPQKPNIKCQCNDTSSFMSLFDGSH